MSDSNDHDRRALGIAAAMLRNLADDRLYSDAFRHRIMDGSSPDVVGRTAQVLLYGTAERLDRLAERLGPPDTPAARLARQRAAKRRNTVES